MLGQMLKKNNSPYNKSSTCVQYMEVKISQIFEGPMISCQRNAVTVGLGIWEVGEGPFQCLPARVSRKQRGECQI